MHDRRLYLKPGDRVLHRGYPQWGTGEVEEVWVSRVPGGICFVRILFQDGRKRVFDNDFDSASCCYYMGIQLFT
jgi:hypothetical protein